MSLFGVLSVQLEELLRKCSGSKENIMRFEVRESVLSTIVQYTNFYAKINLPFAKRNKFLFHRQNLPKDVKTGIKVLYYRARQDAAKNEKRHGRIYKYLLASIVTLPYFE